MVDSRSGSNLLYLPLDKLMQQAGVPRPRRHRPPTPGRCHRPTTDARSRDGGRSRDRESR